jgi:hypothetical protein
MQGKYKLGGDWSFWEEHKPQRKRDGGKGGSNHFNKNEWDQKYKNN